MKQIKTIESKNKTEFDNSVNLHLKLDWQILNNSLSKNKDNIYSITLVFNTEEKDGILYYYRNYYDSETYTRKFKKEEYDIETWYYKNGNVEKTIEKEAVFYWTKRDEKPMLKSYVNKNICKYSKNGFLKEEQLFYVDTLEAKSRLSKIDYYKNGECYEQKTFYSSGKLNSVWKKIKKGGTSYYASGEIKTIWSGKDNESKTVFYNKKGVITRTEYYSMKPFKLIKVVKG